MSALVSSVVEQQLLTEMRRHGVVIWLDKDASYSTYVDGLLARHAAGEFAFPVVGFRGSFLELLFALEPHGSGLERQPLLIHMPGFNEESIRTTPLLELYEPGVRFRKGLETLIREAATSRVAPSAIDAFLATGPTLERADTWMASAVSTSVIGLEAFLQDAGRPIVAEALARRDSTLALRVEADEEVGTLRNYLYKLTGMDEAWIAAMPKDPAGKGLDQTLDALSGWILCVEYVHDLRRPPHMLELLRLRELAAPLVTVCKELVAQLRRDNPDAYVARADFVEGVFATELEAMTPEDLGRIDTFREEESRVLGGAVSALLAGDFARAKLWWEERRGDQSFWLQRDQGHRFAWSLVAEAAEFAAVLTQHPRPLQNARSLEDAAASYAATAFEVDRAHRRFEQQRLAVLVSSLPHFGRLREVATALRKAHRAWADQLAGDFARICRDTSFLPETSMQQRTLYEQVVQPLVMTGEKVAYFLIDAFRFEMATELVDELRSPGTHVDLKPRLCELPSITSVGMNVLAPVASAGSTGSSGTEKLQVAGAFQGFKTGEFTVRSPADRVRAMGLRSAGKPALLLKLADVSDTSTIELNKQVKPHALIVVHSKEIDDAGEANVGLPTFESTLRQIKSAWFHLQQAGVKQFVFTADHGFLLQDETTHVAPFGSKHDPQRRHVVDPHPRAEAHMVNVSMSALGYEGIPGYLLFRDDTAVFATGNPGASFVHGGNSPQERIIPVLTVTRQRAEQGSLSEYVLEAETQPDIMGLHRVRVRVVFKKDTTTGLAFAAARSVDVALRVPGRADVRVVLKDVTLPATRKAGRVQVPVGETFSEIIFGLEGPVDDRVRVELHHPDAFEKVSSARPEAWFTVVGTDAPVGRGKAPSEAPPAGPTIIAATGTAAGRATTTGVSGVWSDDIEDEGVRRVFLHLHKHGVLTEAELTGMLGSPRQARRFALAFDGYLAMIPFKVRIESNDSGKRYVRETDR